MAKKETPVPFEFEPHHESAIEGIAMMMVDLIETIKDQDTEVVIFTDKSARPLSWVFRKSWKKLYPKEPPPEIKFLNVGTEKRPDDFPNHGTARLIRKLAAQQVERFQIAEQIKELYKGQGFERGKRILVVEEQPASGLSYQIIKQGIEKAFPGSEVSLLDSGIVSWNWGFVAEVAKEEESQRTLGKELGKRYCRDYGDATIGVTDSAPESIQTKPYYRKGMRERTNFGNVVIIGDDEGGYAKLLRPHHDLRRDLNRAVEKTVELMQAGDRHWREENWPLAA